MRGQKWQNCALGIRQKFCKPLQCMVMSFLSLPQDLLAVIFSYPLAIIGMLAVSHVHTLIVGVRCLLPCSSEQTSQPTLEHQTTRSAHKCDNRCVHFRVLTASSTTSQMQHCGHDCKKLSFSKIPTYSLFRETLIALPPTNNNVNT
jgi:hypothetical protein